MRTRRRAVDTDGRATGVVQCVRAQLLAATTALGRRRETAGTPLVLTPGDVVAGYRIDRLLGEGGMGAVYLAAHPSLPRQTALKVLSSELSRDPDFRARFLREAEVASALEHPNIVAVYDRGRAETGELWIAMQFVDGTDADAALRGSGVTAQRAIHIIGEVAKALDYAHSRSIVHRDIKPANFLLSGPPGPGERVLLGDFGIARALDDYGLTATGSVVATFAYAAPEVLSGHLFDGRADIYSLGCTLFRLLTGHTPFPSTNGMAAVMMSHLTAPPPRPSTLMPALPSALDDVIAIAMAKDPAQRFPTATALAHAATAALHGQPLPTPVVMGPAPGQVTGTGADPWWHHIGSRTQMAGSAPPPAPPAPPPPAARPGRRRTAALAGAVVATVAAATVSAVAFWPEDAGSPSSTSPPGQPSTSLSAGPATPGATASAAGTPRADVPAAELRGILLPAAELNQLTGMTLALDADRSEITADPATVSNRKCVSAWAPAQRASFDGDTSVDRDTVTASAVQSLRALTAQPWHDGVIQAAVTVGEQPAAFVLRQQRRWAACAGGGPVTITTPGSAPQSWTVDPPTTTAGIVTMTLTAAEGSRCQRGVAARGNVIFDVRQCRSDGVGDVAAIIRALEQRIPN